METKKEIRSRLKKQRSLLGADECRSMSHEIYKRLIALELDREYDNILLYSAIRNEVNTDEYFTYLINKAKRIYYPRVSGNTMSFYRVRRYLSSFTKRDTVMAVGVGYDFQLLSSMTFEDEYDVPLDGVITDKREVFIDE